MRITITKLNPDGSSGDSEHFEEPDCDPKALSREELQDIGRESIEELINMAEQCCGRAFSHDVILRFQNGDVVSGHSCLSRLAEEVFVGEDAINPNTELVLMGENNGRPVIDVVPSKHPPQKVVRPFVPIVPSEPWKIPHSPI